MDSWYKHTMVHILTNQLGEQMKYFLLALFAVTIALSFAESYLPKSKELVPASKILLKTMDY